MPTVAVVIEVGGYPQGRGGVPEGGQGHADNAGSDLGNPPVYGQWMGPEAKLGWELCRLGGGKAG